SSSRRVRARRARRPWRPGRPRHRPEPQGCPWTRASPGRQPAGVPRTDDHRGPNREAPARRVHRSADPPSGALCWDGTVSTQSPPVPSPRPAGLLRAWTGEDTLADVLGAVVAFTVGLLLLGIGLVDLVSETGPLGSVDPEPWWRVALLAVGCL